MILFYDACAIIYQVELKRPYFERLNATTAKLLREHPDARIAVSALSLMECRVQPLRDRDAQRLQRFDEFFSLADLIVVPLDTEVLLHATALRAEAGLRTPDALQAASALSLREPLRFVTNDSGFKKVPGLNPVFL